MFGGDAVGHAEALLVGELQREAVGGGTEEHLHADLALGTLALQQFLELLVLVAPEGCTYLDIRHLVGDDGASLHAVDEEALQAAVGIVVAESVAIGEGLRAADSKTVASDVGHLADVLAERLRGGEVGHGLTPAEEVVGIAAVEGAVGVGGEVVSDE